VKAYQTEHSPGPSNLPREENLTRLGRAGPNLLPCPRALLRVRWAPRRICVLGRFPRWTSRIASVAGS